MKTITMISVIVAGLALSAHSANPNNNPSASTAIPKTTGQLNIRTPLEPKAKPADRIERYGNFSSRPWAQIADYPRQSLFVDEKNHEARFNLFWFGRTPE